MGSEAECKVHVGKRVSAGRALLETTELLFRPAKGSDLRLKIPFKEISSVDVAGDVLKVSWPMGTARFDIGNKRASTWAESIRNPKGSFEKLGIRPEHSVFVGGALDADFRMKVSELVQSYSASRPSKDTDLIFLAIAHSLDLHLIEKYVPYMKRDGAIWTVTPKGKGGIKDTDVMAAGKAAGLVDVKVVSFSDTHSANKFVIPKAKR